MVAALGVTVLASAAVVALASQARADKPDGQCVSLAEARYTYVGEARAHLLNRVVPNRAPHRTVRYDRPHVTDVEGCGRHTFMRVRFQRLTPHSDVPQVTGWGVWRCRVHHPCTLLETGPKTGKRDHGNTPGCVSRAEADDTYRGETLTHFTYRVGPDAQYERDPAYPGARYYRGCAEQTPSSPVFIVQFCKCMDDKTRVSDAVWGRL